MYTFYVNKSKIDYCKKVYSEKYSFNIWNNLMSFTVHPRKLVCAHGYP